jgi:hypothetical protein
MPRIKIGQLKEGMVLKADVLNRDQMLLIPAGCELRPNHIQILEAWGVNDVSVQSGGDTDFAEDPLSKVAPEVATKWEAEYRQRFWQLDETHPVQAEVFRRCLRRWVARKLHRSSP